MRKHNRNSAGKKKGLVLFILATFLFSSVAGGAVLTLAEWSPSPGISRSSPVSATPSLYVGQSQSFSYSTSTQSGYYAAASDIPSASYTDYINGNSVGSGSVGPTVTYKSTTALSGKYDFKWYYHQSFSYTFNSAGTYTWQITLDGSSGSGSVTVSDAPPTVNSITASPSIIDAGQTVSLSASVTASSGTSISSYTWSDSGGTLSSTSATNPSWSASSSGTYTIYLTVTDNQGATSNQGSTTVTVNSDPSVSLSSSKTTVDEGSPTGTVVFTASASGGSGSYSTYNFYLNGGSVQSSSSNQFTETFTSKGSQSVYVTVTDSLGYTSGNSNTVTVNVNSDPSVSIASSQNPTDTGNTVEFSSTVSGGTPGYTYTWTINGNTYSTRDVNISFSSSGTYIADLTVTDAAGYSVSQSYSQTVNSDPTVSASSNVSSADVGYPIEFLSSPSGGVGPYTYSWMINGNQVSTFQDFSYTFSSPGPYTATVTVTDSVGKTYSASATVTINSNPSVSITSSQNPTDVGNSVNFKSSVSGGTGSDTYVWTINGAQESTSSAFSYSFNSVGTYYVNLTVTDGDSHVGSASFIERVNSDPSVVIHAIHNPSDIGIWANFSASVSGGTPGYAYSWTINGQNFNASYVNYTFTSAGTFQVQLGVTDANGNKATDTINEVVNPLPAVSIQAKYSTVDQSVNDTFFADITGGSSPFNYTWTLGSGIVNYSQQFHLNFTSTGSYEINLTVRDSLGSTVSTSISVKVIPKPSALIEGSNITDVGTQTYWEGYGSFGTEPYSYYWFINGVNTTTGLYLLYSFPKAGNYNITLLIEDSQGAKAKTYLDIAVVPLPRVAVQLSKSITDTGIPVEFNSSVTVRLT